MPITSSTVKVFGIFHHDYEGSYLHSTYVTRELAEEALQNITGPKELPEYSTLYAPNFNSYGIDELEVLEKMPETNSGFYVQLNERGELFHVRWNEINTLDTGHFDYRSWPAGIMAGKCRILFYGCGKTVEEAVSKTKEYMAATLPELEANVPRSSELVVRRKRNKRRKNG